MTAFSSVHVPFLIDRFSYACSAVCSNPQSPHLAFRIFPSYSKMAKKASFSHFLLIFHENPSITTHFLLITSYFQPAFYNFTHRFMQLPRPEQPKRSRPSSVCSSNAFSSIHEQPSNHQLISAPAGISFSGFTRARFPSASSAQRIIPSDSIPASLAGLRLVTTITFLPTISSAE